MSNTDEFWMWTIYERPRDFPALYVARLWRLRRGADNPVAALETLTAPTLDELRDQLPPGLYRVPRNACDDPVIVETWL